MKLLKGNVFRSSRVQVSTLLGVAAVTVALLAWRFPVAPTGSSAGSSALSAASSIESATEDTGDPIEARTAGAAECVGLDGSPTPCTSADAWLLVSAQSCDPTGASRTLGIDPSMVELLIETRQIGEACAISPASAARAAGATPMDLLAVQAGQIDSVVIACWTDPRDSASVVPCSQAHQYEPVTSWQPLEDQGTLSDICRSAAARYVAGSVGTLSDRLTAISVVGEAADHSMFRCLVKAPDQLYGSVFQLSGKPLPTQSVVG